MDNDVMFECSPAPVIRVEKGCPWAETMVLNPAIVEDPESRRLHMLFRASGPWERKRIPGRPMPYPIFLGYAYSDDLGDTWTPDFSRPALAPALKDSPEDMFVTDANGKRKVNYANGLVEDPRFFEIDGKLMMSVAGRMFPPGPFWEHDEPTQCAPEWARSGDHDFGRAGTENLAVTVLYEVDLEKLKSGRYEQAFSYVTHLTDPERGDNRDVFLFPEKMVIDGRSQYVCVHRPREPWRYPGGEDKTKPTMYLAAADALKDLPTANCRHAVLAEPIFDWEEERVGGSWPPIRISDDEWLLGYHGKKNDLFGYTQSFMILKEREDDLPELIHRCSERMMYAKQEWELPGAVESNTRPALFSCGAIVVDDKLIISYGASDEKVGIAKCDLRRLIEHTRKFTPDGDVRPV